MVFGQKPDRRWNAERQGREAPSDSGAHSDPGFLRGERSVSAFLRGPLVLFSSSATHRWLALVVVALTTIAATLILFGPLNGQAWFFFIAKNGMRQQWVFNSGCNPNSRPITVTYDTDDPSNGSATYGALVKQVHDEWNQDGGLNINIMTDITTAGANITYYQMDVNAVNAYLQNPQPGVIRVVWDADGAVLQNLGVDPENVLGIGVPLAIDNNRPNEICSGLMILNGQLIGSLASPTSRQQYYRYTLMHELGHVLGFAHSVAGSNSSSGLVQASTQDYIPVMHPFAPSPPSLTKPLTDDEKAGLITVYGQ